MSDQRALERATSTSLVAANDRANPRVVRGLARLDGRRSHRRMLETGERFDAAFPSDRALGRLYVLDDDLRWVDAGDARGSVQLPARRFLRFENGHLPFASTDLRLLESLRLLRDL